MEYSDAPDSSEFGNLTVDEIRMLRDNLLRPLILEPVIDPGFKRPVEKLRVLRNETKQLVKSLKNTFRQLDVCVKRLETLSSTLESLVEPLTSLHVKPGEMRSVEQILSESLALFGQPQHILDKWHDANQMKNAIFIEREAISSEGLSFLVETNTNHLLILSLQLQTAQLALALERIAEQIAHGTDEAFGPRELPENMLELVVDGIDKALDMKDLPAIGPIIHIFKMTLLSQHQREQYESGLHRQWSIFEYSVFLSSYFKWWTDNNGKTEIERLVALSQEPAKDVETIVDNSEKRLKLLFNGVDQLAGHIATHEARLSEIRKLLGTT